MKFTTRTLLASAAAIALALPAFAAGPLVTPVQLLDMLGEGKVVALDVREVPKEGTAPYAAGHIPGSIAAPMDMKNWRTVRDGVPAMMPDPEPFQAFMRSLGVDRGEQIVLIYDGSKPTLYDLSQATRAYWTLTSMGHSNVAILNGGIAAWTAAGLPTAMSPTAPGAPGNFTARFSDTTIADVADMTAAIGSNAALVDARPPAFFAGEKKHDKAKRAGTLPGAVNLYGATLMDGPAFKDAAGVKAMFDKAGVSASDDIIAFCNSGFYCSAVWFAASEILGYDKVRGYDGSMIEWTMDDNRPVVAGELASAN